jgi:hypothetical protein
MMLMLTMLMLMMLMRWRGKRIQEHLEHRVTAGRSIVHP